MEPDVSTATKPPLTPRGGPLVTRASTKTHQGLASAVKGVRANAGRTHDRAMTPREPNQPVGDDEEEDVIEHVAHDVRDEIRQGHVVEDVRHVLDERLHDAGVDLRPERLDDLAEEIENDVST
ncbi:hypothetical protein ACFT30_10935 [Microbacterium ureisolvens]|uniref:hypothetical protein n=1 Tax=Microbacterium ureisolvens TaxID=2781186 RepID=UPI0036324337